MLDSRVKADSWLVLTKALLGPKEHLQKVT